MKINYTSSFLLSSLMFVVPAFADTLTITYHTGKTQKITLESPHTAISDLHFDSSPLSRQHPQEPALEQKPNVAQPVPSSNTTSEKSLRDKVKYKWAEPASGL